MEPPIGEAVFDCSCFAQPFSSSHELCPLIVSPCSTITSPHYCCLTFNNKQQHSPSLPSSYYHQNSPPPPLSTFLPSHMPYVTAVTDHLTDVTPPLHFAINSTNQQQQYPLLPTNTTTATNTLGRPYLDTTSTSQHSPLQQCHNPSSSINSATTTHQSTTTTTSALSSSTSFCYPHSSHLSVPWSYVKSSRCRVGLSSLQSTYPLRLTSPKYFHDDTVDRCCQWLYVSTYGGGLVAGDKAQVSVEVGSHLSVVVASMGYTKVYGSLMPPSHVMAPCEVSSSFTVRPGGMLAIVPHPVVCFRASSYKQKQVVHLEFDQNSPTESAAVGSVVLLDWLASGRLTANERWCFDSYDTSVSIYLSPYHRPTSSASHPSSTSSSATIYHKQNHCSSSRVVFHDHARLANPPTTNTTRHKLSLTSSSSAPTLPPPLHSSLLSPSLSQSWPCLTNVFASDSNSYPLHHQMTDYNVIAVCLIIGPLVSGLAADVQSLITARNTLLLSKPICGQPHIDRAQQQPPPTLPRAPSWSKKFGQQRKRQDQSETTTSWAAAGNRSGIIMPAAASVAADTSPGGNTNCRAQQQPTLLDKHQPTHSIAGSGWHRDVITNCSRIDRMVPVDDTGRSWGRSGSSGSSSGAIRKACILVEGLVIRVAAKTTTQANDELQIVLKDLWPRLGGNPLSVT
eukprot:GHVS01003683.1.p1 GENE.GHVS01003683.1~~GHVS01003683.1.p1  ORF type:complete len:678 (+),score=113.45 GHVS01003683.1:89-2122(+)